MNKHVFTSPSPGHYQASSWERPLQAPEVSANKSEADIAKWGELVDRVIAVARQYRWSKAEVTRRAGMKDATFHQWFSGRYEGRLDNHNAIIEQWLDALEAAASVAAIIPQSPAFMPLRASTEVVETLAWAQICPDLVMITLGAGMGKTAACEYFANTRPHVYHATVSESTKTVHGMLTELAEQLGVQENNPARLARAIGGKVKRTGEGTLLIVDEGQHLNDEALNQLRHFVDVYKCGVAVVGNSEVYSRFTRGRQGPSYAQLKSRIGKRLQRVQPYPEDLETYIAAWEVSEPSCVKFLMGIGMKGGAFRQIEKTVRMARMVATGEGAEVSLKYLQAAWKNRDVEDMA
ncbi:AAA family ATPase [Rhizobium paknamense]|uniref:DNA transposition AAA+ family ATPase n=1 Tax=Rhizobium paknamense TaxID=1206817 RepID=A0ABU0IBF6_9HYPH|nr:AAA family ATPase [Rhizobium paknamense]MDQ0454626.1 DNA transposition AAA+ family ATPase [Rhizobium paknamense]